MKPDQSNVRPITIMKLEMLKLEDAHELFELTVENRTYLRKWLPWVDGVQGVSDTEEFIRISLTGYEANELFTYAIWQEQTLVGICGFNKLIWEEKMGYIGYWLGEKFQGQGLMSRACLELEKIALNELGIQKLDIRAAELNRPSRAIPERLGYVKKRTIPDAEWLYDHHVNHVVYEKDLI